jgi:hypothetical protein
MKTPQEAHDRLIEAYDARGAARQRARLEVDRQFAAIIARLHQEYADANRNAIKHML